MWESLIEHTYTSANFSVRTPSISARISTVTLSVSTMATTSSVLTAWPVLTAHSTMVPYGNHGFVLGWDDCKTIDRLELLWTSIIPPRNAVDKLPFLLTSRMESPISGTFIRRFSSKGLVLDTKPLIVVDVGICEKRIVHRLASDAKALEAILTN